MKYALVRTIVTIWACHISFIGISDPVENMYQNIKKIHDFDSIHAIIPVYEEQASESDMGKLFFLVAWKYENVNAFGKAFDYYNLSLKLYENTGALEKQQKCLENLGRLALRLHQYDKARKYYTAAWAINMELGDEREIGLSLRDIGITLSKTLETKKEAIWYLEQSADLLQQIDEFGLLSKVYLEIGAIYKELGSYDRAMDNYYLALDYSPNSEEIKAMVLNNHSEILLLAGAYEMSLMKLDSAIVIKRKFGDEELLISSLNMLGVIHFEMGNFEKSIEVLLESFNLNINKENLTQYSYENLRESYAYMDSACLALGDESRLIQSGIYRDFLSKEAMVIENLEIYRIKDLAFQGELIAEKQELAEQRAYLSSMIKYGVILIGVVFVVLIFLLLDIRKRKMKDRHSRQTMKNILKKHNLISD